MSASVEFAVSGLLFDCDGVLVDSDAAVIAAWSEWARRYGLDPVAVSDSVHGRRSADTVAALIDEPGRPEALQLIDRLEVEAADEVTALPGAAHLVSGLPEGSWAIVTSGVYPLATARLAAAGIAWPEVLITGDMLDAGKPAPDGYLQAAGRLGLDPTQCVVFEDAPSGVAAARNAGVGVVIGVGERAAELDVDAAVPDLRAVRYLDGVLVVDAPAPDGGSEPEGPTP